MIEEIAGYRVVRELGAGGMGQVFLVEHPRLPRLDALKLLDAGVSRNDDFKMRFQRDADLLAQNQASSDGTLFCSAMTGAWRDRTHQNRPAVEAGAGCTEPGARARVNATDAIATCRPSDTGGYTWQY